MSKQILLTAAPLRAAQALVDDTRRVITPNRRAAQALDVEPVSLVELATDLLPDGQRVAPEVVSTRELTGAVRKVVGGQHAARQAQVMAAGLARLLRAGADLTVLSDKGSDRVKLLAAVGLEYRARLAARGMVDQAELLHVAAQTVPSTEPVLVYGYARLDADERAFLNAYAGEGSTVVLPDGQPTMFEGNREARLTFESVGWERVTLDQDGEPTLGERVAEGFASQQPVTEDGVRLYECANPEAEVRAALGQVKQLLVDGTPAGAITVVTRDEDRYAPLVLKIASEYGLPVHPQTSGPLGETRLGSYLQRLLTILVEDAPYETTLCALADPLAGSLKWDQRSAAQQRRAQGLSVWREILPEQPVLEALTDHDDRSLAAWVKWLHGLLRASKLPHRLVWWPRERIAYTKLRDGLKLLDGTDEPLTDEQFALEIADLLGSYTVPLDPSRGGVALHTPLSLYGSVYDHVFVLGVAAGQLPPTLTDDPYLDVQERQGVTGLGYPLESAAEQSLRERLSFWMMLQTAREQLAFFRPKVVDRAPTEPSSYLEPLQLTAEPPPAIVAAATEARMFELGGPVDEEARAAAQAWQVECRRESADAPDEYDGAVGQAVAWPKESFSVSSLLDLGKCPFKWFGRYVLKLMPLDETGADPDVMVMGSLYHGVLELVVGAAIRQGAPADRDLMVRYLDPAMAAWLGEPDDGNDARQLMEQLKRERPETGHEDDDERRQAQFLTWSHWPILRREVLATLEAAIRSDDFLKDGSVPKKLEFELNGEYQGVPVHGRVDRADTLGQDGVRLIDYKSGGDSRPPGIQGTSRKLDVDLQLPLYAALYQAREGVQPRTGYFKIGARKLFNEQQRDAEAKRVQAEQFVADVPARLAAGRLPVMPDVAEDACRTCDYRIVCRVGSRVARKGVS